MIATSDPNMIIAGFAVGGLVIAAFWRFIVWIRDAPVRPIWMMPVHPADYFPEGRFSLVSPVVLSEAGAVHFGFGAAS